MTGGGNNDVFSFSAAIGCGFDTITDFARGDLIRVTGAAFSGSITSGDGTNLEDNRIQVFSSGGMTTICLGTDSIAGADTIFQIAGTYSPERFVASGTDIYLANSIPTLVNPVGDQSAAEDSAFSFTFASNTFADADDTLTYMATQTDCTALPAWLTFNFTTHTFSGTPANDDAGALTVSLTASDASGGSATDTFVITVANTNDAPTLATPSPLNFTDTAGNDIYLLEFNGDLEGADVDAADTLVYGIVGGVVADGFSTLTGTYGSLMVNTATGAYTFFPDAAAIQGLMADASEIFTVSVTDGTATAQASLMVNVDGANDTPVLVSALADKIATGYTPIAFTIPATRFSDRDGGDTLSYAATLADGSALPAWLGFDAATRTFSGTPSNLDVGSIDVMVVVTDGSGASVTDTFGLAVVGRTRVIGTSAADTLYGTPAADTLNGAGGADTLVGGGGDDTYVVDNPADVITELAGEGTDTVRASASYQLPNHVEQLALTGTADIAATGNDLANRIAGNGAGNVLDGGLGADTLIGGNGHDTYIVDDALDVIVEYAGRGSDVVEATVSHVLAAHVEGLFLMDSDDLNGAGNALPNTLTGNAGNNSLVGRGGNDTLDGGAGADTLMGGNGDDTYLVDEVGDVVTEFGGAGTGTDLVRAGVSYTLDNNLERLTLTGTTALNGRGNTLANTLTGNAAANQLAGLGGADTLIGGGGADTLTGGTGRDSLTGGAGSDIFDFNALAEMGTSETTRDVITDFTRGADRIDLSTLDANTLASGNQAFSAPTVGGSFSGTFASPGDLYFDSVAHVLYGNTDGDAAAEFAIQVNNVTTLAFGNFVL